MKKSSLVAEVLGITDPEDAERSSHEASLTLAGREIDDHDLYLSTANPKHLSVTELERQYDLIALTEILVRRKLDTAHTLVDWPVYRSMMRGGERGNGTATALMIGSLCALSSRAFVCLAQAEYGANKAVIVDPAGGKDKARHGLFVRASGLALPFASGSIDFVHTNQLLRNLEDPSTNPRPYWERVLQLLSEITRVLAPGGQLLMKETPAAAHGPTMRDEVIDATHIMGGFILRTLKESGVPQHRVYYPLLRTNLDYLFDPTQSLDNHPHEGVNLASLAIYARKPI